MCSRIPLAASWEMLSSGFIQSAIHPASARDELYYVPLIDLGVVILNQINSYVDILEKDNFCKLHQLTRRGRKQWNGERKQGTEVEIILTLSRQLES